jgi:hypothetical protein
LSSSSLSKPCISERQSGSAVSTNQITAEKTSCLTSSKHVKLFSQAYHSMTKNVYRFHGITMTLHFDSYNNTSHSNSTFYMVWLCFVRCSMQLNRGNT